MNRDLWHAAREGVANLAESESNRLAAVLDGSIPDDEELAVAASLEFAAYLAAMVAAMQEV